MKTTTVTYEQTIYASEVMSEVTSVHAHDEELIAWADAHPVVYRIVTEGRSAPFGARSSEWHGWAQGANTPAAILHRLGRLRRVLGEFPDDCPASIFSWRAGFTLAHYDDRPSRLVGGHFTQWDGSYRRGSIALDYTKETLDEVVERFRRWCGALFPTAAVLLQERKTERVVWGTKDP